MPYYAIYIVWYNFMYTESKRLKINTKKRACWQKREITSQQRALNKNLSKLSAGMLRQGLLNSHNDFVCKITESTDRANDSVWLSWPPERA